MLTILRYFQFLSLLLAPAINVYSQDSLSIKTTQLKEVVVYGLKSMEFIEGSSQQRLDSALIRNRADNIATLLQRNSSVYIKEYGNQMLSTVSLRGTGSGHTATLWNGMNISSPTLGQFDFSQAPSIVADELLVHYGGASSLFGNESIGGAIVLQSQSLWKDSPSLLVYQDFGSFDTYNSRIVFRTNSEKLESVSKFYFSTTQNDFSYKNILLPEAPTTYQKNAESHQEGFLQDLYWRPRSGKELSIHAWYHHSDRNLQPSMVNPDLEDTQEDRNIRLQAAWNQAGKVGYLNSRVGIINDFMLYNRTIATESNQLQFQTDMGKNLTQKLAANLGGSLNHIRVKTNNYSEKVTETRWDIYAWFNYHPYTFWSLAANIRSSGASGFSSPVSPSIGSDLVLKQKANSKITWKSLAGINYRIPTLNDRFWDPGGNPNLIPENSLSVETGFQIDQFYKNSSYKLVLTGYKMWIDNWIIWLPQGLIWSPQNLREVESVGLELRANGNHEFNKVMVTWNASYAFTQSTNMTQIDPYDRSKGKQLPYVPFHNTSISLGVKYSGWNAGASANYTGDRFTSTDNTDTLEDFWLVDSVIGKCFKYISVDFRVLNLLNTTYYHLPYRPLPSRNYKLSITFNI